MPEKKSHMPEKFPDSNGKVGDEVLLVTWRVKGAEIKDRETWRGDAIKVRPCVIHQVGWMNEFGQHLDIVVKFSNGHRLQVPSTRNAFLPGQDRPSKQRPVVLVLLPKAETPDTLRLWALEQKRFAPVIVRNPATSPPQLGIRCGRCLDELWVYSSTTECQELRWWNGRFSLGKPEVVDGWGDELKCSSCELSYEMPNDVEPYL